MGIKDRSGTSEWYISAAHFTDPEEPKETSAPMKRVKCPPYAFPSLPRKTRVKLALM